MTSLTPTQAAPDQAVQEPSPESLGLARFDMQAGDLALVLGVGGHGDYRGGGDDASASMSFAPHACSTRRPGAVQGQSGGRARSESGRPAWLNVLRIPRHDGAACG